MRYEINQVSSIEAALLYHYRILKQPAEFLSPVYTDVEPLSLVFNPSPTETSETDDYGRPVYEFQTAVSIKGVPILQFRTTELEFLSDCLYVDVENGSLALGVARDTLPLDLEVQVYDCKTYKDVADALDTFKKSLDVLRLEMEALRAAVGAISYDNILRAPEGSEDHLIMFGNASIEDSLYEIKLNSQVEREFNSPSQEDLDALPKYVFGTWKINCMLERTLSFFRNGILQLEGSGRLYLYQITSTINIQNFTGTVVAQQCPNIILGNRVAIDELTLIKSTAVFTSGRIRTLTLVRQSTFEHAGGYLQTIGGIGVACTYQLTAPAYGNDYVLEDAMNMNVVQGYYINSSGDVYKHGKEISFVTGQVEYPDQPDTLYYIKDTSTTPSGGSGTGPYPDVTGGIEIPDGYASLSTEDYKTLDFTQRFMCTSAGPQTVEEIEAEQFHTLRACMNWCIGEFGPSIYGVSYGKLIRTWCMYEQDSSYRGSGKTLNDFILRLRGQVMSWGGHDIWNRTLADLKAATWITDEYALEFMQNLYNNIRYPDLFGITLESDIDVIQAMSGMPTMNETIHTGTGEIPSRNKPVVWSVSKRAVLNEFSGYEGYYVLYRPEAFASSINRGVNVAVTT